jgi:hypothetical protein
MFFNKATAQIGTWSWLAYSMPDCWLEVSLHPEGQLDQGSPWLSWYPNSTLHCMLPMQPSQW